MSRLLLLLVLAFTAAHTHAENVAAPSFTLADSSGHELTLPRSHDGVDIYFFWASWCPYCKALMPHLQSIKLEYGDDVRVYALHIRDDEDPVKFMDELGYDFLLLPDADPVMTLYGVRPTPALFLVDGHGLIRFNLYKMIFDDSERFNTMSHKQRAGQRAPHWSAEIRRNIDQVLEQPDSD